MADRTADGERRFTQDRVVRLLPFLALVVSFLISLVADSSGPVAPVPVTAAISLITAGWIWWLVTRHPQWQSRTGLMAVFFVGELVLSALLVLCHPVFGFFAWTGYLFVLYALRGRWRLAGAAAVGTLSAASQAGGFSTVLDGAGGALVFLAFLALNVGIGTAMTYLSIVTDNQAVRRQRMLGELAEANAKLEAALTENAGLHAQLLTQAREAGVLDERQRMAGEIHDVLAQGLTGIVTQLEAADAAADRPGDRRRHLDQARRLARDGLTEARRSVQALSPRPLAAATLPEALAGVVDDWSALTGVSAELITTGTARPLLPEIEATLLRTAQEALANVAKHAGAERVGLTLSYMEDLVSLDVRDDGAGFDPASPRDGRAEGGFGLAAMRERVLRIAGRLEVESEPGGGTAVSACVPAVGLRGGGGVITLLIVDDHPVVRDGLKGMFAGDDRFRVLGEAADGHEALTVAEHVHPDVVLMDLRMPGLDGVATITALRQRGSTARVLVLTTYDTDSDVLPAIRAGATGYLLKDTPREELFRAVTAAHRGESVLSPSVAGRLLGELRSPAREPLSPRELEVLRLISQGSTNRETAMKLFISEATVKTHLLHVYAKLGVRDRAAAVATAFERGLLGGEGQAVDRGSPR